MARSENDCVLVWERLRRERKKKKKKARERAKEGR